MKFVSNVNKFDQIDQKDPSLMVQVCIKFSIRWKLWDQEVKKGPRPFIKGNIDFKTIHKLLEISKCILLWIVHCLLMRFMRVGHIRLNLMPLLAVHSYSMLI